MFAIFAEAEGNAFNALEGLLIDLPQGQNRGGPILDGKLMVFTFLEFNPVDSIIQNEPCRALYLLAEDKSRLHVGEADVTAALGGVILVFIHTFPPDTDDSAIQPAAGGLINFLEGKGGLAVVGKL